MGVLSQLDETDIVVSNHRCHGHFLAHGGDPVALYAELMGKASGVCGGRGGSQHLHWRNFYSNGIQGGIVPLATGMALAEKHKGGGAMVVVFIGDGTLGEGVLYEALNMASLWSVPILYVLENNRIAQTTPIQLAMAGEISSRFEAFDIPALHMDSSDVLEIAAQASTLIRDVRVGSRPRALVIDTVRFGAHSKGDDTRPEAEMADLRARRDPLQIHGARLTETERKAVEIATAARVKAAFEEALEAA